MAYTVYSPMDEEGAQASGLNLSEAFARVMALARCDYAFGRFQGDMHLTLTPSDAADDVAMETPPACRSKLMDDAMARAEIMRRFIKQGMGGYRIVTDEEFAREERTLAAKSGLQPARRVEFE
jgi:hypothetical protein